MEMKNESVTSSSPSSWKQYLIDRLPLFYVFLSGIGFSYQALAIKMITERGFHGSFQLTWIRGIFQFFLSSWMIYFSEDRRNGVAPKLFGDTSYVTWILFFRSVVGFSAIVIGFLSTEKISVGDSTILIMLSPTIASILGCWILSEPWRIPEMIATVFSLLGVLFISRPSMVFGNTLAENTDRSTFYLGVTFGFVSAVGTAFVFILIRILGTTANIHWSYVTFSQSLGQLVLAPLCMYVFGVTFQRPSSTEIVVILVSAGCIGALSQAAMTVGLQREKTASASAMRLSDVIFGYLWQVLFTSDSIDLLSIIGAVLIVLSILSIVVWKSNEPQEIQSFGLQMQQKSERLTSVHIYSRIAQDADEEFLISVR